ncbi:MAG: class I SAM-dependent methyltransferase [Rhodobacterales bacterium]|nr:class I SAM-dependent methyltransferase [Rhodobacterales bacterium]
MIGRTIRRALGPYERQASELYRRMFIDLEDMSALVRDWARPARIIEIGCGEGALAERLVRDFPAARYTGIDIIPHLGRMYAGPADRVQFRQVTADDMARDHPFAFDLVVINDVLHHVPPDLRPGILAASRTLLAPGGSLILKDWVRRPTPIHAAVYIADAVIGGDRGVAYMTANEQRRLIADSFGDGAVLMERSVRPWRQNLAFHVRVPGGES